METVGVCGILPQAAPSQNEHHHRFSHLGQPNSSTRVGLAMKSRTFATGRSWLVWRQRAKNLCTVSKSSEPSGKGKAKGHNLASLGLQYWFGDQQTGRLATNFTEILEMRQPIRLSSHITGGLERCPHTLVDAREPKLSTHPWLTRRWYVHSWKTQEGGSDRWKKMGQTWCSDQN